MIALHFLASCAIIDPARFHDSRKARDDCADLQTGANQQGFIIKQPFFMKKVILWDDLEYKDIYRDEYQTEEDIVGFVIYGWGGYKEIARVGPDARSYNATFSLPSEKKNFSALMRSMLPETSLFGKHDGAWVCRYPENSCASFCRELLRETYPDYSKNDRCSGISLLVGR